MRLDRRHVRLIARDACETAAFLHSRDARVAARAELTTCRTSEDFYRFTQRHFVRGAAQNMSEITAFVDYARRIEPRVVCEIGVQDGGTNFILSRALGTVTTIVGIDLYVSLKSQLRFYRRGDVALHIIEGSSQAADTHRKLQRVLGSRPIDVLFIDGDHTYEGALRDFSMYSPLVRAGGLIAFHDIVEDSYTRFAIKTESYVGDVPTLWRRVREHYHYEEFIDAPDQDGRGIGVIEQDPAVAVLALNFQR